MSNKYKMIDLFAGCGGLEDGFLQSGKYEDVAAVEWLKPQVNTLIKRLETKWKVKDAKERVMHFDIQREKELFEGWQDDEFGQGKGLDYFVNKVGGIDIIIGGPPCQAYSVAGRVRDENGMRDDYRNYLFEHYLNVVNRYRPKLFVFENVPGILSAAPDGTPITDLIRKGFEKIGYEIIKDLRVAKVNASDYSVPQNRERMIIVGVDAQRYSNIQVLVICQNVNHFGTKNIITRRHLMKHQKVIIHGINLGIIICGIWIRFVYWHMILNLENESMTVKKLANCMRKK